MKMSTELELTAEKTRPITRQACNRCHSAKLRCRAMGNNGQCARCIKAGAECVYDPPQRLGRPRQKNLHQPNAVQQAQSQKHQSRLSVPSADESHESSSSEGTGIPHTPEYTGSGSPMNAAVLPSGMEESMLGVMKEAGDQEQRSHPQKGSGSLAASQVNAASLGIADIYSSGEQQIQADENFLFNDFLATEPNFGFSMTPPPTVDFLGASGDGPAAEAEHRHTQHPNPTATPVATLNPAPLPSGARKESQSCSRGPENRPEDLVLSLTQLQAKLTVIHGESTNIKQAQSLTGTGGKMGEASQISDDGFKSQLQANIGVLEQTLEILGRINEQARPNACDSGLPCRQGIAAQIDGDLSREFGHRQRDGRLFPGPFSEIGRTDQGLDSMPLEFPSTDPQDSITTMLVLTIYLRLLHNFNILVTIMCERIKESASTAPSSNCSRSGPTLPAQGESAYNPVLDVSLGSFSFSSSSAKSLQVVFNIQLINTLLAKIKASIQRTISRSRGTRELEPTHNLFSSVIPNGVRSSAADGNPYDSQLYYYHNATHRGYSSPSHEVPPGGTVCGTTGAPGPLAAGIDRVVRKALAEIDIMSSNLQGSAVTIQKWTIERT